MQRIIQNRESKNIKTRMARRSMKSRSEIQGKMGGVGWGGGGWGGGGKRFCDNDSVSDIFWGRGGGEVAG